MQITYRLAPRPDPMKHLLVLFVLVFAAAVPNSVQAEIVKEKSPTEKPAIASERDGSSFEKAIRAASVDAEYQWLAKHYPGYRMRMQSLRMNNRKPFDVLSITTKDGKALDVYFDISSFFGK
jgi:hypothetical protein